MLQMAKYWKIILPSGHTGRQCDPIGRKFATVAKFQPIFSQSGYDDGSSAEDPSSLDSLNDRHKIDLKLLDALAAIIISANEDSAQSPVKIWAAKLLVNCPSNPKDPTDHRIWLVPTVRLVQTGSRQPQTDPSIATRWLDYLFKI